MLAYSKTRQNFWDTVHSKASRSFRLALHYHRQLARHYQALVPKGQRVLELGCGDGKLLAALEPGLGVGVDFSHTALQIARQQHPHLTWIEADVHDLPLHGRFDVIILSDLLNDVWDAQLLFERLRAVCHSRTRILINSHSRLWQLPLSVAEALRLKNKALTQNWFTTEDIANLLDLANYQMVKGSREVSAADIHSTVI